MFQARSVSITDEGRVVLAGVGYEWDVDPCDDWPPFAIEQAELSIPAH